MPDNRLVGCTEYRIEPVEGADPGFAPAVLERCNDLLGKFCELGAWRPAFLEIEVSTGFECLDRHVFAPFPGKYDKREIRAYPAQDFQKGNPVHVGHLVIGNHNIVLAGPDQFKSTYRRRGHLDCNATGPFKIYLAYFKK